MRLIFLVLLVFLSGCVNTYEQKGLEAVEGEDISLPDDPPQKKNDSPIFNFNYSYVYRTAGGPLRPLKNGSRLHSGDRYTIQFTPNEECYVYIFQYDSSNKLFTLFPQDQSYFKDEPGKNNHNPVKAGMTYFLPKKDKSYILDKQTGDETIHILVSKKELQLEELKKEYEDLLESRPKSDKLGNDEQKNLLKCDSEHSLCVNSVTFKHLQKKD